MTELTQDQIERACEVFQKTPGSDMAKCLHAAAPFLQLPWDEPSEKEMQGFYGGSAIDMLCKFVRRRNVALMPKPVTPTGFEGWKIHGADGNLRDVTEKDVSSAVANFMREHPPQSYSDDHVG